MIEPILRAQLEPVARRYRRLRFARALAISWAAASLVALAFVLVYRLTGWNSPWLLPAIVVGSGFAALIIWKRQRRWQPDYHQIARQVEQGHPELHALLLTAVEQRPDASTGRFNYLQERVIREAVQESYHADWLNTVSEPRLFAMQAAQVATFVLLLTILTGLQIQTKDALVLSQPRRVQVSPGDTTIERGNGLAILARFEGSLPPEVTLVIRPDSQAERRIPMAKSLDDPVFGGTLPEITSDLTYFIEHSGERTADFKVKVFEYPRLERVDAHLAFPAYTGLPEKKIEDTRRISAVEGSMLDLSLQLNKPVASAKLVAKDKTVVPLAAAANRANVALEKFPLETTQTYDVVLVDADGRTNKVPTQIVVEVLKNRTPELKFVSPRGDQRVSPLEEISFQGEAWDDFGLQSYGLTYALAGGDTETLALGNPASGREKRSFNHLLGLEDLAVEPDQLISYYIWADDIGPDGQVRRTASDMFFAEVRPFEEIFREGQAPSASESSEQEQGESSESMQLAELQKEIINATWKLQRGSGARLISPPADRDSVKPASRKDRPAPDYGKDVGVVEQSQKEALKRAGTLKERAQDPRLKTLWDSVEKEMDKAADHLGKADKSPESLPPALAAEQAAYQALLKLASREHEVSRSRSRSRGGNQRNQRQLDQLDLSQSEDNYETQRQASAARQSPEQREQLQVLNRLKELAQRQQDLNERLKELQTALQEAKSEQEREEIQRRLKRLREEEQQMLADVDELLQRMERPENQSRMADARQQLEQTRNQVQRASEMMEQESVGQALSSSTRAQRELQDLRDDFRKKNSAQFAEEMRQMRSGARELADKEEKIGEKLQSLAEDKQKKLSDSGQTRELLDQLGQQKQKMTNLLEQMKQVSQESEVSEPLLSRQLYDTLRKASQGNTDEDLEKAGQLLKLSFFNEAGQFEQRARQDINELKQGVERAAESVLGDEIEALRLARAELDELARQVENEMAQANPGAQQGSRGSQQGEREPSEQKAGSPGNRGENSPENAGQPGGQGQGNSPQQAREQQLAQANQSREGQNPSDQQASQAGSQNSPAADNQSQQPGQSQQPQNGSQTGSQQSGQAQANASSGSGSPSEAQADQNSRSEQAQAQSGARPNRPRQRASLTGQRPSGQNGQNPEQAGAPNQNGGQPGEASPRATQNPNGQGGGSGPHGPLTGEEYSEWSDRLREVEEMLDFPELRNEVAGVRERARAMRLEFKRHSKPPQWPLVHTQIAGPLAEVRDRVAEELARRESKDSLVPIDRDPVPQKFSELVRRYYEKLGSSE